MGPRAVTSAERGRDPAGAGGGAAGGRWDVTAFPSAPRLCWALPGSGSDRGKRTRSPHLLGFGIDFWPFLLLRIPRYLLPTSLGPLTCVPAGGLFGAENKTPVGLLAASPEPAGATPDFAQAAPIAWDGISGFGSQGRRGDGGRRGGAGVSVRQRAGSRWATPPLRGLWGLCGFVSFCRQEERGRVGSRNVCNPLVHRAVSMQPLVLRGSHPAPTANASIPQAP